MTDRTAPSPIERSPAVRWAWGRGLILAAVVAVGAAFLVHASQWAGQGFGYSHDGFNGAVWGQGARALVDDPAGSRLGGIQPDGHRYANHPPLTVWSSGASVAVAGDRPLAARAPAVVASLAALALLAVLLAEAGASAPSVAAGVAVAGTTPMFFTYGAMLDTPIISFPCGLAALIVAQRCWQGRAPAPGWIVGAGALVALSGWHAALIVALAAGVCLLSRPSRRSGAQLVGGLVLGTALTAAWIVFVHGSFRPLFRQAGIRSSEVVPHAPWSTLITRYLEDLYRPATLALVVLGVVVAGAGLDARPGAGSGTATGSEAGSGAAGAGGRPRRWLGDGFRPLAAVLAVALVGYTVLFRNGSAVHDYWTFWGVALVAVAAAALVEAGRRGLRGRSVPVRAGGAAVLAVGVLAVVATNLVHDSEAEAHVKAGLDLLPILAVVPRAPEPTESTLAVWGTPGTPPWADYAIDGRAERVETAEDVRALPPDRLVLVVLRPPATDPLRTEALVHNDRFALVRAPDLAAFLQP